MKQNLVESEVIVPVAPLEYRLRDYKLLVKGQEKVEERVEEKESLFIEVVLNIWQRRKDLQMAFPEPKNLSRGYLHMKNILDWAKEYGVREEPAIREYLSGKGTRIHASL